MNTPESAVGLVVVLLATASILIQALGYVVGLLVFGAVAGAAVALLMVYGDAAEEERRETLVKAELLRLLRGDDETPSFLNREDD